MLYNRYTRYYPVAPLAVLLGYFIYKAVGAPFSDFAGYYFGGQTLLQGHYQQVYDTYSLNALIAQKGYAHVFVSYSPFPPFTALVFAPFLLFPVTVAKVLFNICSALLFVFTIARVARFFDIPKWLLLLLPVVFFIPLRNNIFFGQGYLLLVVLMLEGYMAWKKGRLWLASLLWAIAIVFKLFPLVIIFYLVTKRQYKPALYCLVACLGLGLLSLLVNGWAVWQYYVFTVLPRANNGELNDSYTYLFQSAFMLLKNLLVYDAVQRTSVWYNSPFLFTVAMALFKALLLACCVGITLPKKVINGNKVTAEKRAGVLGDFVAFTGWILASLLLSPNGSSYSLILLLLPLLAIGAVTNEQKRMVWLYVAAVMLFVTCTMPVQWFANLPLLLKFPRLYLLLLLLFLLMRFARSSVPVKWLLLFFVLLVVPGMRSLSRTNDNSVYFLNYSAPLMYNYAVKNGQLVYYYWDDGGSHETLTGYVVHQYTTNDVSIQNNQVYYKGRQLTNTPDQKKQATYINGKYIVYLSDKNRGIGFYTLRVISLTPVPGVSHPLIPRG